MSMRAFENKVVIVTGASSGIGAATALNFARAGAKVVVAARRSEKSAAVVEQIQSLGGEARFLRTDVTQVQDIEMMVATTLGWFGRLDCAVNNAGIAGKVMTPVAELEEDDWDEVMNVNLKSVWMCMKYEIRAMLQHGSGAIVNISSIYGVKPGDIGNAPYVASKFGVIGLSKTAAVDYGRKGIRVNVVSPGFTLSEMVEPYVNSAPDLLKSLQQRHSAQNRLGSCEEVAAAITWLCSGAASFVNGANLTLDGGDTSRLY